MSQPVLLAIAGFDPASGAGITADVKTFAAHGFHGVACISALTVQSTRGVRRIEAVAPALLRETLAELKADFDIRALKIGMLAAAAIVEEAGNFISEHMAHVPIVLDPVLRASSGAELLPAAAVAALQSLARRVTVITPNAAEAAALAGLDAAAVANPAGPHSTAARSMAAALHGAGIMNVVITGGDAMGAAAMDLLSVAGNPPIVREFSSERVPGPGPHGTGCAFSSALAANLAGGHALPEAVERAKQYITAAIRGARQVGSGAPILDFFPEGFRPAFLNRRAQPGP